MTVHRHILALCAVLMFLGGTACPAQPRLRFDGVALRGSLPKMTVRLQKAGWNLTEEGDRVNVFSGRWMGRDGVTLTVIEDERAAAVTDLGALVPCELDWRDIESAWKQAVEILTGEYGRPASCESRFPAGAVESDAAKLIYIQNDKCFYRAMWHTDAGDILAKPVFVPYAYYILVRYSASRR